MQNSLAQGRHSVNALVSLAPSPLEDSAHSFHVISFQSDQLQSKLKFGVIFDAAGIRQGFCPWSDSLEVESHFSLHSGPCSEEEMHGQAAAMISASQEKLALQSHLLFGEPLKRDSDGNASSRNFPYTNWHNTLHLHNSFFLQGSVDIDTWPFIHCILLPWVRWLPTLVGGREALALRPPLLRTCMWSLNNFVDISYFRCKLRLIISVWSQKSYEGEIAPGWKPSLKSRNNFPMQGMDLLHLGH